MPAVPPAPKQGEPIHFRQSKIEHNRVVLLGMRQKVRPFPVTGVIHGVSGCDQRLR